MNAGSLYKPLAALLTTLVVLAIAGVAWTQLRSDRETYTITAKFEKAIGLFDNSDVNILGVPVGKVVDVDPSGTRVEVTMEIDRKYKVPADAHAQIVPISVISDRYVQLFPPYTGGPAMRDGAVLDVDRTQIPAELDDVFKQLKKLLDAIEPGEEGEPGALGELVVQLDAALEGREEDLRGTLVNAAELSNTLAGAQDDLSGILVNLDRFFGTLATRAGSLGSLNKNLALVLTALAESRKDLEAAIASLADVTGEVGGLVRDNRVVLGRDLRIAARLAKTILEHRASFEQSLEWLPVAAEGLARARHGGAVDAIDVRDNLLARFDCTDQFAALPGFVRDFSRLFCHELKGEPEPELEPQDEPALPVTRPLAHCVKSARKVRREIRRVEQIQGLPADDVAEIVEPMRKRLRKLARQCKAARDTIERNGDSSDGGINDIGDIPLIERPPDDLAGTAAGASAVPSSPGFWDRIGGFFSGLIEFVGWSS